MRPRRTKPTRTHAGATPRLPGMSNSGVVRLPVKLQSKLHGSRVGLDVRNSSKLASRLMHPVGRAVLIRRQTEAGIRKPEVLMVQGIKHFPPELKIPGLSKVKLFRQRRVYVGETWRAGPRKPQSGVAELIGAIVVRIVVRPKTLI